MGDLARGGVIAVLLVASAWGQEEPKKQAASLVEAGNAAFGRGDHVGALARYREAYRVYPSSKLLLNMAAALEKLDRAFEAAEHYDRFLTEIALEEIRPELRRAATDSLRRIEARVARLRVVVEGTPQPSIVVNAEPRFLRPGRPLYVPPGMVRLTAEAPGRKKAEWSAELQAGQEQVVNLVLEPAAEAPPAPPPAVVPPPPVAERSPAPEPGRLWTWIAGSATVALLAGGIAMWIATDRAYDEYERSPDGPTWDMRRETVKERQLATRVLMGAAAGGAAATVVLYVVEF